MLDLATIQEVWHLSPILSTRVPTAGTIHQTLLLITASTAYALRAYCFSQEERYRIEYEHDLIHYAIAQSLPALAPLPLSGTEECIFSYQDHFYALFPFAPGYQSNRDRLTHAELTALGTFLGQMHHALHDYPSSRVQPHSLQVDSTKTLAKIAHLETVIRARTPLQPFDLSALNCLDRQRAWIEQHTITNGTLDLADLEHQVIHGDYQKTNLFFARDTMTQKISISAIIDWDQAYYAPRAWEVVRTLHYACLLEPVACAVVLAAYRAIYPLSQEDLQQAAIAYSLSRAHSVWAYEEFYLEGNARVSTLIDGDCVPFIIRWNALRKDIDTRL
ncbi:MAG TPA: phosphotransferase [Ktedonobacteraceae bacterium]|nr:phosphotransferase [Ktedonobacteraceae bacterium]